MQSIAFFGAGKMGAGVAMNLIKAGHILTLFQHRHTHPLRPLLAAGASASGSVDDCLIGNEVIFTCLPSMQSWEEVFRQIAAAGDEGSLVIDLTSGRPERTRAVASELLSRNISLVDAPMLKGPSAARDATIQLLVGGDPTAVDRAAALFTTISEAQYRTGGPGTGHALKLINNAVTLTNSAIVYETFALAAKLGIDLDLMHRAMNASAASSKRLNTIAPVLISGKHPPSFDIGTALKDLELYGDMIRDSDTISFAGEASRQLYRMGAMLGLGDQPVTRLGEMLFDLYTDGSAGTGRSSSIHTAQKRNTGSHA